jgi:hypothetical protein
VSLKRGERERQGVTSLVVADVTWKERLGWGDRAKTALTKTLLFLLDHHLPQLRSDFGDHGLDLLVHGSLWKR